MTVTRATADLMVEDVNRTVAFYVKCLGFHYVFGVPAGSRDSAVDWPSPVPLAFAMVESGQARLMFQSRASLVAELPRLSGSKIGGSMVVYLECDDLDALYARVSEHAPFLKAPHLTFYGTRECSIEDVNGYVLTFAEPAAPNKKSTETPA